MREHLSRAKRRIITGTRWAVAKFKKKRPDPRMSDVHIGGASDTVILRERMLRVEFVLSKRNAKKFFKKYKVPVVAFSAVLLMGIFVRFLLVGFATTADFYSSSCLGSWDNVQNALGKPDLNPFSPASDYTPLNSAVFSTSSAQMFCGNFSGATDISGLEGKNFQSAQLVLSWYVALANQQIISGGGGSDSGGAGNGDSSGDASSTTNIDFSTSTASSSDETLSASSSSTDTLSDGDTATSTTQTSTSTDASDSSDAASATTTSTDIVTTPPATDTTTPPASPDITTPDQTPPANPESGASSWLYHFIPVAFADDSSTTSEMVASSVVVGVPSTTTIPTPITVNTQSFQNIVLPSSTPGDFLGVVYSTDGVTWQPLVDIHNENWQTGRYQIPITSWDGLRHLQIAFVGLGAPNAPKIFLDAVGVEVSYVDTPEATTDIAPSADQAQSDASSTANVQEQAQSSPENILQQQAVSDSDIFQQGSNQQCVVAPFSQAVSPRRYCEVRPRTFFRPHDAIEYAKAGSSHVNAGEWIPARHVSNPSWVLAGRRIIFYQSRSYVRCLDYAINCHLHKHEGRPGIV
jgi:hypothetical protein